ncbi:MAG TPA: nucleotide sugar dehydrogenase [Candidatus Binatia bacterium]|nr:nucleotide sugar dehydrogenase [Candidatus Binatia bacterium]
MSDHAQNLADKLARADAHVVVVGLGYVGLPLAAAFGRAGFRVTGVDVDLERVSRVNAGRSYIGDVADQDLGPLVLGGRLRATTGFEAAADADAVVICVPTPLRKSKEPDISFILAAMDGLLSWLRAGQLLVLESTTYPGTTEEVLQPRLEARGFVIGHDFFLAFSPERVDPGNRAFTTANIPKVVGGVTATCTRLAAALYGRITERVHSVSSPRVAETAKLLENTFRSVNIALANELALACRALKVDPWEVIEAAATKPFGFMPFYPGPGTGGHCIPLDPLYLSWKVRLNGFETRFIALADEINHSMPRHVVGLVTDALNDRGRCVRGARILILGVTYKRDVADVRESPALEIIRLLEEKGAEIDYSDPLVPELHVGDRKLSARPLSRATLAAAHCVVIVTDHQAFDYDLIAREAPLIVDVRNALRGRRAQARNVVTL